MSALTHVLLVIFVLLAFLVGHDDADTQGVEDGVISVGVVWWESKAVKHVVQNKLGLFLSETEMDSLGSGWSLPYRGEL